MEPSQLGRDSTHLQRVGVGFPQPPASNMLTGTQHNYCFISLFLLLSCVCWTILHACEYMYVGVEMHIYMEVWVNVRSHPGLFFLLLTETRPRNQTQSSLMGLVSLVSLLWKPLTPLEVGITALPSTSDTGFWGSKTKSPLTH